MICYKAAPQSRDQIRRYVRYIKEKTGFEDELYFPILQFVENVLPMMFPDFQFEIVPISEMGNKHGEK